MILVMNSEWAKLGKPTWNSCLPPADCAAADGVGLSIGNVSASSSIYRRGYREKKLE